MLSNIRVGRRGSRALYVWDGSHKSVTDLMEDRRVVNFVQAGKPMTYGSTKNKLRLLLKNGNITPNSVRNFSDAQPQFIASRQ